MSSQSFESIILQAGAGAGKTTRLIRTFLEFVASFKAAHQRYPKIIVTTFTRKATQEVKERLLRKALESGDRDVYRYIGQKSQVHISTIHGVLSLFLSRFGKEAGLPSDFEVASQSDVDWLLKRELRRCLNHDERFLTLLEEYSFFELWDALEAWREACSSAPDARPISLDENRSYALKHCSELVREAHRLGAEIRASCSQEKWLEWGNFLAALSPLPANETDLIDLVTKMRAFAEERDFPRKSKSIDERITSAFADFRKDFWEPVLDEKTGPRFDPSFLQRHEDRATLFAELAVAYHDATEAAMAARGWIAMSDLERKSLEIVRKYPHLAASFAKEWDYWMIDEYQDTSPVQVELMNHLVADRPHFVVGDPQQSIYFFRGARSEVFFEKVEEFARKNHTREHVQNNHRSRAPVLEFVNECFADKSAFTAMTPKSSRPSEPERPAAVIRVLDEIDGMDVCATTVVAEIQKLIASGVRAESICVLGRKNKDLQEVQSVAREVGLPIQVHSAGGFAERREIKDVLCFIRFLANPADNLNFLSLARSPWFHLSDPEIQELCKGTHYWNEAVRRHGGGADDHPVPRLLKYLELSRESGFVPVVKRFYTNEGLVDTARFADPSERREANLWKLLQAFENASKLPGFSALAFVGNFQFGSWGEEENDAVPAIEPNRVQLMTVHASKGLEFEHVFLTHMHGWRSWDHEELFMVEEATGRWTLAEKTQDGKRTTFLSALVNQLRNQKLKEESERLLYVAMTRAIDRLTLVWQKGRMASDSRSWVSILPIATTEGRHDHEHFSYEVDITPPSLAAATSARKSTAAIPPRWSAMESAPRRVESVTSIVEGHEKAPRRRGPVDPVQALLKAQRGTLVHSLFEALKYRRDETSGDSEFQEAMTWLSSHSEVPFLEILENGEAEWGFAVAKEDRVIQGQIDLWGSARGKVWVLDYKTGSMDHRRKALDQLCVYAWALARMGKIKNAGIEVVAVYPFDRQIVRESFVDQAALDASADGLLNKN